MENKKGKVTPKIIETGIMMNGEQLWMELEGIARNGTTEQQELAKHLLMKYFPYATSFRAGGRCRLTHLSEMGDDRIYGSINGCPVWITIEVGGWVDCWPYKGEWYDHGSPPDEIWTACHRITDTCEGLGREAVLEKAKELGFVPD
jgi:hypothetical protein